jgi:Flp pilus assembly pilin Flp
MRSSLRLAALALARPLRRFNQDRRGANMVEYILLVGVVALIAIAGFKLFGGKVREKIDEQGTSVGGINGQAQ